ncbi:tripartite tricarboxylate transporter substrate binding protein [Variovorax sp. KK3]|uniref:Bug family tripartite tricarboxylate transporter substrate binding protein n=1 Tax=Variovorax sp. KK3 TaxID=1855728 RepID=UPI00097BD4F3|nr:tripartite tricarboxylate transporter substrate binding protein [Variovorax sp. KK3]
MSTPFQRHRRAAVGALALLVATGAWSQPIANDRPIKLVIPFAAGGAVDVLGRILATGLASELGQPVVVDNRTGATGHIGGEAVAKAPPDGQTLLLTASSAQVVSSQLLKLNYRPMEDLVPVSLVTTVPNVMVVSKELPVTTVSELIAYIKAHPGQVSFASHGLGSNSHLAGEMFAAMAGVELTHVPYSSPQMIPDLLSGRVQLLLGNVTEVEQHAKSGALRMIAFTGTERLPEFPQVPTVAETLPGFSVASWGMLMAPAKTPQAVLVRLNTATGKVLARPDVREAFAKQRFAVAPLGLPQTRVFLDTEAQRWARVIRDAKVPMLN